MKIWKSLLLVAVIVSGARAGNGWTDLGGGVSGTALPSPQLVGLGVVQANALIGIQLTGASVFRPTVMLVGPTDTPTSFKGGVLHPLPTALAVATVTDGLGMILVQGMWPNVAVGTSVIFQFFVDEPGSAVSLSNGLKGTTTPVLSTVEIKMWGAGGASGAIDGSAADGKPGGAGGYAEATFLIPTGNELRVLVGEGGQLAHIGGGGGGGRCDISTGPVLSPTWLLVAGGGGGGSRFDQPQTALGNAGGPGGGIVGLDGLVVGAGGGGGGTQIANGAGGFPGGNAGTALIVGGIIDGKGGDGGGYGLIDGQQHYPSGHAWGGGGAGDGDNLDYTSGGGGGGWHGGGGGAFETLPVQNYGGGGGGGSGYCDATAVLHALLAGGQPSMPWVAANSADPMDEDDAGTGGTGGAQGKDGLVWIRVNGGEWKKFTPTTGPEGVSSVPVVHAFVVR
jgi:hypothetical protein